MASPREELAAIVAKELAKPVPAGAQALTDLLRARFGSNLRGVLFYGSNQRRGVDDEGLLDLYAFVDNYRSAFSNPLLVLANRVLPPNVFYLETQLDSHVVRCKYAVLSLADLSLRTTARSFEPYFWARFAQPCTLVWAAGESVRATVTQALVSSIETFIAAGLPLMPEEFESRDLWITTWRQTYRAELRAERPDVVEKLWNNASERYERVTRLALGSSGSAGNSGKFVKSSLSAEPTRNRWGLRIASAKLWFLLRLLRNGLIFEGGIDYILWKMARHSDVAIDKDWRRKRWPIPALLAQLWRLYRAGTFR